MTLELDQGSGKKEKYKGAGQRACSAPRHHKCPDDDGRLWWKQQQELKAGSFSRAPRSLLSEFRANIIQQGPSPRPRSQFDFSLKVTLATQQISMSLESSDR